MTRKGAGRAPAGEWEKRTYVCDGGCRGGGNEVLSQRKEGLETGWVEHTNKLQWPFGGEIREEGVSES